MCTRDAVDVRDAKRTADERDKKRTSRGVARGVEGLFFEDDANDDGDATTSDDPAATNADDATTPAAALPSCAPLDPAALEHSAVWNDDLARIEMHLRATRDFSFEVSGEKFSLRKGETIHTENSHKFTRRSAYTLLLAGGWTPVRRWLDDEERFSVILAIATEQREAP